MNVYDAIMKAADHIEAHPKEYRFISFFVPECGGEGCLWGHIGAQLGITRRSNGERTSNIDVAFFCGLKGQTADLYNFMNTFYKCDYGPWCHNAKMAAKGLRAYAQARFAPVKPRKTTQELVADLMTRVMGERIPEDA